MTSVKCYSFPLMTAYHCSIGGLSAFFFQTSNICVWFNFQASLENSASGEATILTEKSRMDILKERRKQKKQERQEKE